MDNQGVSEVEVLRIGTIHDRGFNITSKMLDDYVSNFEANVYGTDIQVNLEHNRGSEAAGWVTALYRKGTKLMATVEWTELGQNKISKKLFRFVSAELAPEFKHHADGKDFFNVFIGLALTNTPALKGQEALALSESLQTKFNQNDMGIEKKPVENTDVKTEVVEDEVKKEDVAVKKEEVTETVKTEVVEDVKLSDASNMIALAEFTKLQEEHKALKQEVETKSLNDLVDNSLMLSSSNKSGFVKEQRADVFEFVKALTEEQRAQFIKLSHEVRTVELGAIGSNQTPKPKVGTYQEKVVDRTEELLSANKGMGIEEAQNLAMAELKNNI